MRSQPTAAAVTIPADLLAETIETLEQAGCQFFACQGETLEPIDMVTCHVCATLPRLRSLNSRPKATEVPLHQFEPSGPGGTCGHAFDSEFKHYCGLPQGHEAHTRPSSSEGW